MNPNCINVKAIPNFKYLADHYKVSEGTLKQIIYKYRIETNNEDAMPTETYIMAQLGKIQYEDRNSHAKIVWDKWCKKPQSYNTKEEFEKAKTNALSMFPDKAIVEYIDHEGNMVLTVKEPVERIIPKKRADFKTWQEYNDYLRVYGEAIPAEAREKEQQLVGTQPFTFNDGTTVTVPFRPNSQQEEALNEMNDFLKSNETSMTLSGYAGTGKTSLMEIIAAKAKQAGKKIIFSASTNKAASVLRDRVKSAGYTAETLNKVFGIAVTVDESQPYDESTLKNVRTEAGVTNGAIVVIDEASMINEENYRILNEIAQQNNLKIIYVGDKGQLPPVNESQVSKVFRDATNRRVTLTKVERTDDNAILQEATNIRNGQSLSGESSFNKEGKGVAYVKKSNKEAKKAIVERFVPYLKQNPDYFRILAFHNDVVAQYNEAVRNTLGYTDNTPRVGEPIVGYKNWGQTSYNRKTKQSTYKFINSESYKVTEVGKPKQIVKTLDNGTSVTLQAIPVTLEDNMGEKNSFDFIDVKGNPQNLQAATILAQEKARIHAQARGLKGEAYARAKAKINDLEKFLFINADIEDEIKVNAKGKHPLLQGKVFDFGYAMTVHKSQGSTFKHVMVDDADIATARNTTNIDFGTPINLSFGEESYEAYEGTEADIAGPMQDITLDWDNPSPTTTAPEAPASESNAVNIRQQLEYVAVSRATDTVTIIANDANVKKEDTPLNHVKATSQDNNTINQQKSRSNKTANLISATIAPYFNTSYENYIAMTPEEQKEMRVAFAKAAKEVAKALGISLDMKEASFNIGGYEFDDGGSVVEPSFTFRLDTTPENARLFAALMGDLGYEQQEAVVSNYDIEDRDNADGIRFSLEFKDSDTLLKLINQFDIKNFTYDKTNGILSVLSFDTADVEKFHNLVQQLKENGYDKESETFYFKSSYDGRTGRKTLYGKWLKAQERNSQEVQPELYSLVQEALKRVNYYSGKPSNYEGLIEPDEDTVFVFGSNPKGIHGAGAAATAKAKFGAIQGQGEGLQGNSYALPTKDLDKAKGTRWYKPGKKEETEVKEWYKNHDYSEVQNHPLNVERTMTPQQIIESIKRLYEVANQNPDKQFKVSHYPFGQLSLNGYLGEEMLAMFKQAGQIPSNIIFNKEWTDHWDEIQSIQQPAQQTTMPEISAPSNFRTYGEAYGTVERDNLIQELLDDGYPRENIQVEHIPATETEDDFYLVKIRDNSQAMVDAITQQNSQPGITVKLPGYEHFNGLYEDTTVDAEWKVPILQDLDSQLSIENTEQENDNILEQMTRVMQATSEEDYLKAPTAERKEVNDKMSDYWRRNNQMNVLMDNEVGLAASEVREVAEDIVNSISDIISEIQSNPEKIKELFPTLNVKTDLANTTRKEIVQTVNINNLINEAKRRFENIRYNEDNQEAYDLYDSIELLDQANLILDNWDTIMELAADVFVVNEGFSIKRDTKKQSFDTAEREFTGYDYDNFTDPQDEDSIREQEDEQEHWQVEARTIDAFNSMSEQVRLAYHNCYELDRDGNKVLNKWGIPKRVNKVKAVAQTLRWTQGALDINEMIEKLHQKEARYPWLSQLLEKLEIKEGQENPNTDFQSQFYGVMHRHFQLYSIGQMDSGVYASKLLNSHIALSEVMKSINAKFQLKGHPLFHDDGAVVLSSLNALKGWYKELTDLVKKYNIRTTNEGRITTSGQLSEEDIDIAAKNLTAVSRMFGYNASEESVRNIVTERSLQQMWGKLGFAIDNLEKAGKGYDPFNFEANNNIRSEVMGFLTPIVEELEDVATNSFFDNGKMYQSYVIPSFLTQLFDQFKQPYTKVYQWMDEFYGQSEWFKDKEGNWKLPWLNRLYGNPKAREVFDHKVQLNFNKHDYMRNMSPEEFTLSVIMEYFSERLNMKDLQNTPAWFRVPIQSNKPSSEFIKFYADRMPGYKERIAGNMYGMFLQELSRIDTVRKRNLKEGDPGFIASFDENGRRFLFLPWLNPYLEDGSSELGKLLQKKLTATVENQLSEAEEARLMTLVQQKTMDYMQQRTNSILQNWKKTGILKAAEKIKGIKSLNNSVRENLENFLWNDFYAANSILQMTIVDKAFYPHATELQKRLAELHAPGTRGNKYATDYNGKRVSDGFYRTIIIQDLKGFTASIIDNITEIFDRKIANAPESEKPQWEALKESLVGEKGAYRRINVTDGQAYSSPSSYRKKAFMFGKWSRKAEDIYQRLLKGDFSISDLEVAFQPLKPFVYGHLSKNMGVDVAPITKMPVPFQAKNSEYLLILADALMRGQETGRPNLLKAIYDIMEESERLHPGQGIDTVQFDSAIKSGNQAVIDITPYLTMPGGEVGAYTLMKKLIYQEDKAEDLTSYNYDTYVHKTDYDNYALQQEVPPHFREHQQAEGSQQRMNIPTDLDFYDYSGQVNKYSWKDPDGTEHSMDANEFRKEYERVHAANIEDSFNKLAKELHLNSTDKKARNLALSEILQNEIMSSPRYGIDLFQACQIDPATGEFRIPKGDPIQGKRIEQLINSIIKNRVNKQKISGGPIVQVTNFGTSKQLHIRFQDKNGNILMTKEEYEKSVKEQPASQTDKFNAKYGKKTGSVSKSYKEYLKENQAGVAHFEIFAPIGMKKLFDKFKNPDGSINLEAVEKCDPELLKVITGRIPNEDKYSIAHGKIVGFMPALAGDAIMFPAELTEIDDSDFDVDKRYTMQKVIYIKEKTKDELEQPLTEKAHELYKEKFGTTAQVNYLEKMVNELLDYPEKFSTNSPFRKLLFSEYQKMAFYTEYPKKGTRDANNNQIIDMSWAVMSNEMTADKILNPGGFEIPKHTAYVIAAYRNSDGSVSWESLEGMSTKELQKLASVERDLAWFNDHVQFYKQNAAGSNLIGVFAVNKVAHATLEGDGLLINVAEFCGEKPFTICDTEFNGMMPIDSSKDTKGQLIGKNIGSGIGASADTAKDPWLDSININMTTAGMFNTLLRMGMPMEDAELFMAQDVILRLLTEFNRKNLEGSTTIDKVLQDRIDTIKKKYKYTDASKINTQPLTRDELKEGLLPIKGDVITKERDAIDYKTLLAFQKIKVLTKNIRKPTQVTRLNSISSAVGPLIIDNIILEHKLMEFLAVNSKDRKTGFYKEDSNGTYVFNGKRYKVVDMQTIFEDHPILEQFSRPIDSRKPDCPTKIMFNDMPAGSSLFKVVLKALPKNIDAKIYDDRQLLSKLSDFFQSYLLVANNVIKPEQLKNYLENFPKEFEGVGGHKSIKEQYPDNAFIQAIQLNYEKKSNKAFLNINTTGMKEQEKEKLRMAWTDLHKVNPELSTKLFTYAFFRGGIGFSPKTWMGLTSIYVKEHIKGYVDTYRHFPTIVPDILLEQFIRNNWDNSTLVPRKGGENTNYQIDLAEGTLIPSNKQEWEDLDGIEYFKTVDGKNTYLWKLNKNRGLYTRIYPLGNNGEYVEISTAENMKPLDEVIVMENNNDTQELPETSQVETDAANAETPDVMPESEVQQAKTITDLIPAVMALDSRQSPESAKKHLEDYVTKFKEGTLSKGHQKYLINLLTKAGIEVSMDNVLEKFREFC